MSVMENQTAVAREDRDVETLPVAVPGEQERRDGDSSKDGPAREAEDAGGSVDGGENRYPAPWSGRRARFDPAGRVLGEMEEMMRESRWGEMVDRYHPVSEKLPHLVRAGRDVAARGKVAFALGQLGKFDEAIAELEICVERFPDNFMYHGSLAYTAYNSLFAAKNREILLSGEARKERVELARTHFGIARQLRPSTVTVHYREGMLLAKIEDKPEPALALFLTAVENWRRLGPEEQKARHQERKNYVKALYQAASCCLALDDPERALALLTECLEQDERSGHMEPVFKYFALGKIRHYLGDQKAARDALDMALKTARKNQPVDWAYELLARVCLAMDEPEKALAAIHQVPERKRRPYVRWTEADALVILGRREEARRALLESVDRDQRGRHKALIRLAHIEFEEGRYEHAAKCGEMADRFFREKWGNPYVEGSYWWAMSLIRLGRVAEATAIVDRLESHMPSAHRLSALRHALAGAGREAS